jgi:ParB family chromosome partitioning protein
MGIVCTIINIENLDIKQILFTKIVSQNSTFIDTEALVRRKSKAKTNQSKNRQHLKLKKPRKGFTYFGSKVDVKLAGNGREDTIPFQSEEDFNRIMELIKG